MTVNKKKSLGQNFLTDHAIVERIVTAAQIVPGESVLEVGPGAGILTEQLLSAGARVFAIEIDHDLLPQLQGQFGADSNFILHNDDIRTIHLPQFLANHDITTYKVVANLPYYITSSIIRIFLESAQQPTEMVLMVQKEVAERICAKPGAMSVLAVAVQFYGSPENLFTVPAHAFSPTPKVDSAVIRITQITKTLPQEEEKQFFRVVRAGFSARRKTLVNNLSHSLGIAKEVIAEILATQGIAVTVRAQELSIAQWKELARRLS